MFSQFFQNVHWSLLIFLHRCLTSQNAFLFFLHVHQSTKLVLCLPMQTVRAVLLHPGRSIFFFSHDTAVAGPAWFKFIEHSLLTHCLSHCCPTISQTLEEANLEVTPLRWCNSTLTGAVISGSPLSPLTWIITAAAAAAAKKKKITWKVPTNWV